MLGSDGGIDGEAAFLVVHTRGVGTLAPLARPGPELATLLWLEHSAGDRAAAGANELLARLREADAPVYAIKQGCVAGPADRPGLTMVEPSLVEAVLDAVASGSVVWERDPDFGYEVPSGGVDLSPQRARALLPRLLYGDHDRVYEHADLVAAKKRARHELARSLPGLDPSILAAAGWPPRATASDWRE